MNRRAHRPQEGFALIVVTALFMAFALIAAAAIDHTNATQQIDAQAATQAKLARVAYAVMQYSIFNNNLYPCPARLDKYPTDATFGESLTGCDGVATGLQLLTSSSVVMGMVPITALASYGVQPDDAFDSWNNRILYAVDRAMTVLPGSASSSGLRLNLTDYASSTVMRQPDFLVMSYGRDGMGAYPKTKILGDTIVTCSGNSQPRGENCNGDLTFVRYPLQTSPRSSAATYFDDLIAAYGR